jgi:hypothetical protein
MVKKIRWIPLFFALAFVFTACKKSAGGAEDFGILAVEDGFTLSENEKSFSFSDDAQAAANNVQIKINIKAPSVSGSGDAINYTQDLNNKIEREYNELKRKIESEPFNAQYTVDYSAYAARNLPYMSVVVRTYKYEGGANGEEQTDAVVFNSATGEKASFNSIFTSDGRQFIIDDINNQIKNELGKATTEKPSRFFDDAEVHNLDKAVWYFNGNKLQIVFEETVLGPHASGQITFDYSLSDLEGKGFIEKK